jgi:hypothetical protein
MEDYIYSCNLGNAILSCELPREQSFLWTIIVEEKLKNTRSNTHSHLKILPWEREREREGGSGREKKCRQREIDGKKAQSS